MKRSTAITFSGFFVAVVSLSIGLIFISSSSDEDLDASCGYNSCVTPHPEIINLHFVCHTHNDPGWLKTLDTYFQDQVFYILNSVVLELGRNPDRKFTWTSLNNQDRVRFYLFLDSPTKN